MWSSVARDRLLRRGLAAVLAAVVVGGALDWGHAGADDPNCSPVLVLHDHAAHRFNATPSNATQPSDHCYLCHSLRTFHASLTSGGARVAAPSPITLRRQGEVVTAGTIFCVAVSSRAPPTLSL